MEEFGDLGAVAAAVRAVTLTALAAALAACVEEPDIRQFGPNSTLPDKQRGLLPSMTIADPAGWDDRRPIVPAGYRLSFVPFQDGRPGSRSRSSPASKPRARPSADLSE